jgi:hypothetical protein
MCHNADEFYTTAMTEVESCMAKQLHMGVRHQACSKSIKLPEQLLALLWLLRYTIHDSESFDRLCHFFYPDKLKAVEVQVEQEIFDPLWIVHYIIYPIMSIEYFLFDKKGSNTFDIYKKFYCKHQQYTHSRTKESIIYSLASIFIEILLENGENPDMITSNKNTQDITQYLRKSESILFNTTLYTLFFQALPHLIENNIELHHNIIFQNFVKKENFPTQRKWPETTSWKNFELLLPLKKDASSQVEVVTIKEYFMAIRTGNIALSTLIQKADCLPKENDVVEETEEERNLRERQEQKNYKENATSDEEDEKDDDEEGESDEEKNKKKDKKRKRESSSSSPRKKINKGEVVKKAREVETNIQAFQQRLQDENETKESLIALFEVTVKTNWDNLKEKIDDNLGPPK